MIDPSLTYENKRTGQRLRNEFLRNAVLKAEKKLVQIGAAVTSEKLIAEQTLGFWTSFFDVHHYKILLGRPIQIFSSLPPKHGRKHVSDELEKIRRFRNRINHNEPICFTGNYIDFTLAEEVYKSLTNILTWIDSSLVRYIKDIDRVLRTIEVAKMI